MNSSYDRPSSYGAAPPPPSYDRSGGYAAAPPAYNRGGYGGDRGGSKGKLNNLFFNRFPFLIIRWL